jgi:hypothetical protein
LAQGEVRGKGEHRRRARQSGALCCLVASPFGSAPRLPPMSRSLVERRLADVGARLKQLREELAVSDEQLGHLAEAADDARLRSLVSETPLADREHHDAQRHAEAMQRHRAEVIDQISRLEQTQDELLDRLMAETRSS